MTLYFGVIFVLLIDKIVCLKQYQAQEIITLLEKSCLVAYLSETDDVYFSQNKDALFKTLSEVAFKSEPLVHLGYINFKSFLWPNNQTLKAENDQHLNINDIVLFPKSKIDRTCLLPAKQLPTRVSIYKGTLSFSLLNEFINNHCNTYRTMKGHLSYEGQHREEILKNIFTVSSFSSITSDLVFSAQTRKEEECSLNPQNKEDIICNKSGHTTVEYTKLDQYEIPKCERISLPTREEFFHNYLKISKPVIIEGAFDAWPAMKKWTNEFLRQAYGKNKVHIKLTPGGEFEGVEPSYLWDNYKTFKIPESVRQQLEFPDLVVVRPATLNMKFSELVDLIENVSDGKLKNVSAYLEYSSIPEHLPQLEEDIKEMPFITKLLNRRHLNIWFSDGNTLGKLHFDPFDNFLCQISGRKEVILFEPYDNTKLYEGHIPEAMLGYNHTTKQFTRKELQQSTSMVMSPVDIGKVDFKRFPKFAETFPLNCTIDEGDVLFMPAFWWHEVQSFPNKIQKRNLAVNYWYEPFLTKEFPCATCGLDINPNYRHLL